MARPDSPAGLLLEPTAGTLRVVDGTRLEETSPGAIAMATPRGSASDRHREHLFLLAHLIGPATPRLYHEVCQVAAQAYWSTSGSVTGALRVAAAAANRHLLQANAQSEPGHRCYGSIICVAVSGDDVFLLKAGSAWAAIRHPNWQESLLYGEEVPALGIGGAAPVRPSHTTVRPGDTMVLTAPALSVDEHTDTLIDALGHESLDEVLDAIDMGRSADDFAAIVVRFAQWQPHGAARPTSERRIPVVERDTSAADEDMANAPSVGPVPPPYHVEPPYRPPAAAPTLPIGERIGRFLRPAGQWSAGVARRVGRGALSAPPALARSIKGFAARLLPGGEPTPRGPKRAPRPVPSENRTAMMIVAAAIPVVLIAVLGVAWSRFGHDARFDALISEAEQEAINAEAAGGMSAAARPHWEHVLELTKEAGGIRPGDPRVTALREKAFESLDRSYGIVRLSPTMVHDLGTGSAPPQLLVRGQMVLVLDPADGWVAELTLGADGRLADPETEPPMLVHTGQMIAHEEVGDLVDVMWADLAGGRQTGSVVILEAGGWTISFDPAWTGEEGEPRLVRSQLGGAPDGQPLRIGSYDGRLYVLDPASEQIWRYNPSGDTYPSTPESYFGESLPASLSEVIDMAIDGNIYLLYEDGTIRKFVGGQAQPFEVTGMPDASDLSGAIAIATDPSGRDVFVADAAHQRIVRLGPSGEFRQQYRAEEAFDDMEALALDGASDRLFTISEGRLFVAPLS